MNNTAAKAAVQRVANGDHSPAAQAQLSLAIAQCVSETSKDVREMCKKYDECPARTALAEILVHLEHGATEKAKNPSWFEIAKLVAWIVLALVVIIATLLNVNLPFVK